MCRAFLFLPLLPLHFIFFNFLLPKNDFDSLFERLTPEQVDAILDEQLSSDSSAEGRSSETQAYGKKNEASDVDKAFDELMAGWQTKADPPRL